MSTPDPVATSGAAAAAGAALPGLIAQLARHAARRPSAPAVVYGEWRLTYRDLDEASNRLAHHLRGSGAARGVRVGLLLERGPDLLVALIAVQKAGAAWLPLEPAWPDERLATVVAAAQPALLVTRGRHAARLPGMTCIDLDRDAGLVRAAPATPPAVALAADDPCYLIHTSGSTGAPKGVVVTHGNLVDLFTPLTPALGLSADDVWTWYHACAFGFSVWEIWGALLHGGCLVIVPEHQRDDPQALAALIVDEGVTVFSQTPTAYRRLLGVPAFHAAVDHSRLRYLALSGEPLCRADLAGWLARHPEAPRLISTYAVTETGGQVTLRCYGPGDDNETAAADLGRPLDGRLVRVVDGAGVEVAAGEPGELWVGGPGVAAGYFTTPQGPTRFVTAPDAAGMVQRWYRTGDRVRQMPDGALCYVGRDDALLKFRGHRIDPAEVEEVLRAHPGIGEAAVGVREDAGGTPRLVAWLVAAGGDVPGEGVEIWPSLGAWGVYDGLLYDLMNVEPARLAAYREAFAAHAPGRHVLDIGTGRDALLARLAVEAGARHVWAVEVLEDAAADAAALVGRLGLGARITVIHGDMRDVRLPQPIEVCTQGIIGNIGSADGIVATWNAARTQFAADCVPVPQRCRTWLAAVELPAATRARPRWAALAERYVEALHRAAGRPFDPRLCLRHLPRGQLLSTPLCFEDLDFRGPLAAQTAGGGRLAITREGHCDGLLLWTEVEVMAGHGVDYLDAQQAWLPVFVPFPDGSRSVQRGMQLALDWQVRCESHPQHPDYLFEGRWHEDDGRPCGAPLAIESRHCAAGHGSGVIHRALRDAPPAVPGVEALRAWLEARLPEAFVPQVFMTVPALPQTTSGKLDRAALPVPGNQRPALARPPVAPRTPFEAALCAEWCAVLGIEGLGVDDDFFDLGGDSVSAVQLTTHIQRWLDAPVPLVALFDGPSVAAMAAWLEAHFAAAVARRRSAGTREHGEI